MVFWRAMRPVIQIYVPLAIAYQMMVIEAPLLTAMIASMKDATNELRAWGLTMQLVHIVFAPIVMLLATSIAFVKTKNSFAAAQRMTLYLTFACCIAMLLLGWTPLLDFIGRILLGYPQDSIERARVPLRLMLFWPAAIGWRRFLQGILIHAGRSERLLHGTVMRLCIIGACSIGVRQLSLSGATAAALIFTVGVLSEAVFIAVITKVPIRQLPDGVNEASGSTLLKAVVTLHAPLAFTGILGLIVQPILSRFLAMSVNSSVTLAVWPILFSIQTGVRGWGVCLQELAVTALRRRLLQKTGAWKLATFIGLIAVAGTLCLSTIPLLASGLDVLLNLSGKESSLQQTLHAALPWSVLLPLVSAWLSVQRGILAFEHKSINVSIGMVAAVIALPICLYAIPIFQLPSLAVASITITVVDLVSIGAQSIPAFGRVKGAGAQR